MYDGGHDNVESKKIFLYFHSKQSLLDYLSDICDENIGKILWKKKNSSLYVREGIRKIGRRWIGF